MIAKLFLGLATLTSALLAAPATLAHDGPHGGELYCDGKHKHHAELVVDKTNGKVVVYTLDHKAKKEVPIAASSIVMKVKGLDQPLTLPAAKATDGKASQFTVKHERFKSKFKPSEVTMEIVLEPGKPAVTFTPEHDDED
jgi:hypothetical protein